MNTFSRLAGFLVLLSCTFSLMSKTMSGIPYEKKYTDTIRFAGYDWVIKDSQNERTGPGTNLFSSSSDNVWLDDQGRLHLRITNRNDNWYCPEVHTLKSLGFGQYTFTVEPLPQTLDKDVVVGMFLYDHDDKANNHNEVDIEISQWGDTNQANSQFVVQPFESKTHRFNYDLSQKSFHSFSVYLRRIKFESWLEKTADGKTTKLPLAKHKQSLGRILNPSGTRVYLNLWIFKSIEPFNLKEFEVVLSDFSFKPFNIPNP